MEKYLKALLVLYGIDFPKTHDLETLTGLLSGKIRINLTAEEQGRLTEYAAGTRYPGPAEVSFAEARQSVQIARRIRKEIRAVFIKETLRPRKG